MPMDRSRYPADWETISKRIRFERADNRCEWCGAENYQPHPVTGSRVILTVAHIGVPKFPGDTGDKSDKMDVRDINLAALCQRCHLNFDRDEHRSRRAENKLRKQAEAGQLSMFEENAER